LGSEPRAGDRDTGPCADTLSKTVDTEKSSNVLLMAIFHIDKFLRKPGIDQACETSEIWPGAICGCG